MHLVGSERFTQVQEAQMQEQNLQRIWVMKLVTLALALAGGFTILILSSQFFLSGKWILAPYFLGLVLLAVVLYRQGIDPFVTRFGIAATAIVLPMLAHYGYLLANRRTSVSTGGHLLRLLFVIVLSLTLAAIIGRLSEPGMYDREVD